MALDTSAGYESAVISFLARQSRMMGLVSCAVVMTLLTACQRGAGPSASDQARALLHSAIEAHGGRDRLAQFNDFRIVSRILFKNRATLSRSVNYRGPEHWSMMVTAEGGVSFRMGIDGNRCWKQERHRVDSCAEGERRQIAWMAIEHNAWVLHQIDETTVQPEAPVRIGLRAYPAIRTGDMALIFDPESHRLVQVRHGQRVDALSDYRAVNGAVIATHRAVFLGNLPDLEETWTEILPGGADPVALRAPEIPVAGTVLDDVDPPRLVAWTEVTDPLADLKGTVERLDQFIRDQGRLPSGSDGVIWTAPDGDGEASGNRWRLAVGVEIGEPLMPVERDSFHLEPWPASHVLGVFHRGDFHTAEAQRAFLGRLMRERGLAPAAGARLQILAGREVLDDPKGEWMSLVRIAGR